MSTFSSMQSTIQMLCRQVEALNPPIRPRFRPPASTDDIVRAEQALDLEFPDALKFLLLCHNGQDVYDKSTYKYYDPLFPMMRQPHNGALYSHYWLAGTNEIVRFLDEYECFVDEVFATIGPTCYHDQFLCFTKTENADCLALDMLPQPGGSVGQVVIFSTQPPEIIVLAPDLETFLQVLSNDYSKGRFKYYPEDPNVVSYAE